MAFGGNAYICTSQPPSCSLSSRSSPSCHKPQKKPDDELILALLAELEADASCTSSTGASSGFSTPTQTGGAPPSSPAASHAAPPELTPLTPAMSWGQLHMMDAMSARGDAFGEARLAGAIARRRQHSEGSPLSGGSGIARLRATARTEPALCASAGSRNACPRPHRPSPLRRSGQLPEQAPGCGLVTHVATSPLSPGHRLPAQQMQPVEGRPCEPSRHLPISIRDL